MASFMDTEAVESEDEDMDDEDRQKQKKKKSALDSSDEEDEEEDEEKAREEMGDFITDVVEESGSDSGSGSGSGSGSESGGGRRRKKRRKRSRSRSRSRSKSSDRSDLDDEDMDLIEENLGVRVKKKRSRIQKMDSDESEDDASRAGAGGAGSGASGDELPDPERGGGSREGSDDEDINDFIVDEEGRPIQRSQKKKKKHIFDDSARQMAEDIFGVAFDYDEFEQYEKSGDESERSEESFDEDDEVGEEEKRRKKELKKKRKPAKTIFDIFDPDTLEKGHYTDQDQLIRTTDIPERMQLRQVPVTAVPEDSDELDREAEWIFKHGFIKATLTEQEGYTKDDCQVWQNKTDTVGKIKKALDFMRQQFLEVPFIAFYRKEYVNPELVIDDLWRVYFMDEKWSQLQTRKQNVRRLFEKMQNYQGDTLMALGEAPIPEGMKIVDQEVIDMLEGVETVEGLKDIYQHFMLYHAKEIGPAQEHHRKKIRDEKEARRARKRAAKEKKFKTILKTVTKTITNKVPTGNMITVTKKRMVTETVTETVTKTVTNDDGEEEEVEEEEEKEVEKEIEEEVEEEEMQEEEEEIEEEIEEEVTDDEAMEEDDPDDEEEEEEEEEQEVIKYASRNDAYSLCTKYKLGEMAARFGLTAEQFGENLRDGYQRNEPEQDTNDPADVAAEYIGEKLTSTEEIIKAAKFMVATQISKDPLVRATSRDVFQDKAVITVKPTKLGIEEIGEDHPCFPMKYLKDKPLRKFRRHEFITLQNAEKDKLIEMSVAENISGMNPDKLFLDEAKDAYKHDGFSKTVQLWNNLRAEAVEMALEKMLFPQLRKELLHKLRLEAIDGIKKACQEKLHEWIQWAPYDVTFEDEEEDDWDSSGGCRVLGIAYENDVKEKDVDTASYAVLISQEGEVADLCKLDHLLKRTGGENTNSENRRFAKEAFEKQSNIDKLKSFIKQKRPHVIAIAAEDRKALDIQRDVQEIVTDLVESDQFPRMEVHLVDNNLAKVYSNTNKAATDFREYPEILKQAISIARRIQDPLLEFSQLCGSENDILCMRYHNLQAEVPEEELLQALFIQFINLTNNVGVDINECVAHNHASNLLQFVGGLGPRKGAHLLKTLRGMTQPRLENRQQLVTSCHMGPKVFINCAGFIKIDTSSLGDSEIYVEVLDGSRIHNEAYEWARKMAVDALEYDEDEGNPASALEDILRQPDKLDELNLDAFAEELERQGFGNKSVTLYDIKAELNHMYKDHRTPFQPPNPEQTFDIITKESPQTFFIGKLLMVQVNGFSYKKPQGEELDQAAPVRKGDENLWQCPFCGQDDFPELTEVWNHFDAEKCPGKCTGVRVRLDNGVGGFIQLKNLSDSMVTNPEERVQYGQRIYIRVTKIIPEKLQVDCTSKSSDLVDENWDLKPKRDDFYDLDGEGKDKSAKEELTKKKKQTTYIKRVIVHPAFHNISFKDAEKLMQTMDNGEVIIRPSSKGENHLTVTWKVAEGIFQHIDVREEGKENAFSLGTSLWIGSEEFEDLDEIIARHINPMASHMRDLLNFKNYREFIDGNRTKAEDALKLEKKGAPNKIHYFLSASKEMPGKVMLSYMPRTKPRHEFVTVTPDGYRFRKRNFESLPQLMKWFKEHFRDPIPQTPGVRGGTTRTPYGGGTPGGITPGAMRMAGGETPGQGGGRSFGGNPGVNAPYTPTANTPFMTPYNTPGPSMTPRHHGSTTPRPPAYPGSMTPRQHGGSTPRPPSFPGGGSTPSQPGNMTPGGGRYAGGSTPGGGRYAPGGSTPGGGRYPPGGSTPGGGRYPPGGSTPGGGRYPGGGRESPGQGGWSRGGGNSRGGGGGGGRGGGPRGSGGDSWAQAAEAWASGRNSRKNPREGGTTPRPNDPRGYSSGTPKYDDKPRTPRYENGANSAKRTPKGQFGDATPLYDE